MLLLYSVHEWDADAQTNLSSGGYKIRSFPPFNPS